MQLSMDLRQERLKANSLDGVPCMQQGSLVLCEKQNYAVAEVHCVGLSSVHHSNTQGAGGFAVLAPLPEVMWSPDTLFKLSLRRISLPSAEVLTAALKKELSKFPSSLEVLRKPFGKQVRLDAGRKLTEHTLEVLLSFFLHLLLFFASSSGVAAHVVQSRLCIRIHALQ